jgi:hypothetical protein
MNKIKHNTVDGLGTEFCDFDIKLLKVIKSLHEILLEQGIQYIIELIVVKLCFDLGQDLFQLWQVLEL